MSQDIDDHFTHIIPGAADKGDQFLSVVRDRTNELQIGLGFEAARRGRKDGGGFCLKASLGNGQGLEVFAEPMGPSLHVGYQLTNKVAGGSAFGNVGIFGEINRGNARRQNKGGNVRALQGKLEGFRQMVFGPVIQELTDAVAQQQGRPARNGFLGA